jgi:hypothetical protein
VHQAEPSSLEEPPEFLGEGDAEAPLDPPLEQRSNRYARLLERTGELTGYGTSHRDLVPLSAKRYRQVHYVPLGAPKAKRVDD